MTDRRSLLAVTLAALALCAGCGAPTDDSATGVDELSERGRYVYRVEFPDGGLRRGVNAFEVQSRAADGAPARVTAVEASMPAHPHQAVSAVADGDPSTGEYTVRGLSLPMGGRWVLTLHFEGGAASDQALVFAEVP
ncbi:MAG: FixH family protein [Polyangiales bacterium]